MSSPMPTTPKDIITLALKTANVIGVGQSPSAEDINDSFNHLNMMLAQWRADRANTYAFVNADVACDGREFYTIGPGGDLDIPWMPKIGSAFISQFYGTDNRVDYSLNELTAREDYNRIGLKQLKSFPSFFYYDSQFPVGNLFVWPIPDASYHLTVSMWKEIQRFQNASETIILPEFYHSAILWNLTVRLAVAFGVITVPDHQALAKSSFAALKRANAQTQTLQMPAALRKQSGTFNIYGDIFVGR